MTPPNPRLYEFLTDAAKGRSLLCVSLGGEPHVFALSAGEVGTIEALAAELGSAPRAIRRLVGAGMTSARLAVECSAAARGALAGAKDAHTRDVADLREQLAAARSTADSNEARAKEAERHRENANEELVEASTAREKLRARVEELEQERSQLLARVDEQSRMIGQIQSRLDEALTPPMTAEQEAMADVFVKGLQAKGQVEADDPGGGAQE